MHRYWKSWLHTNIPCYNISLHCAAGNIAFHCPSYNIALHGAGCNIALHCPSYNIAFHGVRCNIDLHCAGCNIDLHCSGCNIALHCSDCNIFNITVYLYRNIINQISIVNITQKANNRICQGLVIIMDEP